MEDYNSELSYGASESRYADVRAQREQRRLARENSRPRQEKRQREPYGEPPPRAQSIYDEPLDDDFYGERPKGSFGRVLLTQAAVCALLLGLLFFAYKAMPNTYRQLKTAYTQVMRTDMSVAEVWAAAREVFARMREDIYVIAPYKNAPEEEFEPSGGNAGGMDIALEYAARNCTAAPLRTTAAPVRPVAEGRLTSPFGYRVHPITGEEGIHTGMDIGADEGEPIYAAFYGTVQETGKGEQLGNYVILEHAGAMRTLYAHCSEILAEEGMVLRAGEVIALVGSTGSSTGPHLHFELRVGGLRCDPAPLFAGEPYPMKYDGDSQ